MDAFSDPNVETVAVMSSAQIGKTALLCTTVAYFIVVDACPLLIVQPTLTMAEAFSKDRLAPMIRDTAVLRGKVKDARSRDSNNTILTKHYPGGVLTIVGSNSPASLASRPIRVVLLDELDKFEVTSQGDSADQAIKRTQRFWNRKIGLFCTPTREGASRIARAYEQGDQRKFFVPCPDCGHEQILVWQQVRWEKDESGKHDPSTARYVCEECASWWDDAARWRAVGKGRWIAQNPDVKNKRSVSFHVWECYCPGSKLSAMVQAFLDAKDNPASLEVFVNTTLGETWKERGDAPEWELLYERRERYEFQRCPEGVLFLSAGIDVQDGRIEVAVYGWGEGKESWLIDYIILEGKTSEPEIWDKLTQALGHEYPHESGISLGITQTAIDTGFNTQHCYAWVRRQIAGKVMAIKGRDAGAAPLGKPSPVDVTIRGKTISNGVLLWPVAVSLLKHSTYSLLRLAKPTEPGQPFPQGYCHFSESQDAEFFKQLTAEEVRTTRNRLGFDRQEWIKTRPRNEALDTRIYATAAAIRFGMDRATAQNWAGLRAQFPRKKQEPVVAPIATKEPNEPKKPPPATPPPAPTGRRTVKSSWMDR